MTHPDPDHLVLLALDEQRSGPGDTAHLDSCTQCRDELEALRAVAGLGREAAAETALPPVSESVWDRIAAETGQPSPVAPRRRGFPRVARYGVVAAAAAAVAIAGTLVVTGQDEERVVAQAQLNRQPSAPDGASGRVRIVDSGSGSLRLKLELTGMPAPAGLYEIWLYDGKTTMIPLGVTVGTEADVAIPPNLTLQAFPVVDVSAQQLGQQEHGTSMVQGTLRG
ncbi:anti-sigma factor [Amycolatopsis solani]|uniref:anti-sigma factor n=1 Tax=Amycolatopsis solani TaxID=3028615 RepID=UPI00296EBD6F|nr:anti-sigma factor [Amycolatopsis sp. MEP2-6]